MQFKLLDDAITYAKEQRFHVVGWNREQICYEVYYPTEKPSAVEGLFLCPKVGVKPIALTNKARQCWDAHLHEKSMLFSQKESM